MSLRKIKEDPRRKRRRLLQFYIRPKAPQYVLSRLDGVRQRLFYDIVDNRMDSACQSFGQCSSTDGCARISPAWNPASSAKNKSSTGVSFLKDRTMEKENSKTKTKRNDPPGPTVQSGASGSAQKVPARKMDTRPDESRKIGSSCDIVAENTQSQTTKTKSRSLPNIQVEILRHPSTEILPDCVEESSVAVRKDPTVRTVSVKGKSLQPKVEERVPVVERLGKREFDVKPSLPDKARISAFDRLEGRPNQGQQPPTWKIQGKKPFDQASGSNSQTVAEKQKYSWYRKDGGSNRDRFSQAQQPTLRIC